MNFGIVLITIFLIQCITPVRLETQLLWIEQPRRIRNKWNGDVKLQCKPNVDNVTTVKWFRNEQEYVTMEPNNEGIPKLV